MQDETGVPGSSSASANIHRARFARSRHRARQHADAHAADENGSAASPGEIPNRPLVPRGEAELITNDSQLQALLAHLRAEGRFAYDSEFIGELTYIPRLCLIQVATADRIALVDPLQEVNLRPFWELIADPSVEKITHAGQQDVEPVVRHLGTEAQNVFDTQIACGFIGMAYPVALSKLVAEMVGARLGKGLTFTHWDQRPLSAAQLRYAADDVRYLPALRAEIGRRLEDSGHSAWAREEFDAMCDAKLYQFNAETAYLRVRGATSLTAGGLAILRELVIWRDAQARAHDVPPRAFLKDEVLIDLARKPVKTLEKLSQVRGLPRPVEHAHGREIVEATLRGLALPAGAVAFARHHEPTPSERFRADALWAAAQCICAGKGIDPALVCSRQDVAEFLRRISKDKPPAEEGIFHGWRREALGEALLELLRGTGHLTLGWENGSPKA